MKRDFVAVFTSSAQGYALEPRLYASRSRQTRPWDEARANPRQTRERPGGPKRARAECMLMTKRTWLLGAAVVALIGVVVLAPRASGRGERRRVAQAPSRRASLPVEVATAVKKTVPVRVEALGTVTPIASVAVKPRLDTEIVGVHFADGARVKKGDLLFTLDSRAIEAQIAQAEGDVARDKAQLEGAERDVARYTELVAKSATPVSQSRQRQDAGRHLPRRDQGRPGRARKPQGPAQLLHDPRADHRPHQRRQRQGRQFRAPGRHRADRDHQPDRADLCRLHGAAGRRCPISAGRSPPRPRPSRRSCRATPSTPAARSR